MSETTYTIEEVAAGLARELEIARDVIRDNLGWATTALDNALSLYLGTVEGSS